MLQISTYFLHISTMDFFFCSNSMLLRIRVLSHSNKGLFLRLNNLAIFEIWHDIDIIQTRELSVLSNDFPFKSSVLPNLKTGIFLRFGSMIWPYIK